MRKSVGWMPMLLALQAIGVSYLYHQIIYLKKVTKEKKNYYWEIYERDPGFEPATTRSAVVLTTAILKGEDKISEVNMILKD